MTDTTLTASRPRSSNAAEGARASDPVRDEYTLDLFEALPDMPPSTARPSEAGDGGVQENDGAAEPEAPADTRQDHLAGFEPVPGTGSGQGDAPPGASAPAHAALPDGSAAREVARAVAAETPSGGVRTRGGTRQGQPAGPAPAISSAGEARPAKRRSARRAGSSVPEQDAAAQAAGTPVQRAVRGAKVPGRPAPRTAQASETAGPGAAAQVSAPLQARPAQVASSLPPHVANPVSPPPVIVERIAVWQAEASALRATLEEARRRANRLSLICVVAGLAAGAALLVQHSQIDRLRGDLAVLQQHLDRVNSTQEIQQANLGQLSERSDELSDQVQRLDNRLAGAPRKAPRHARHEH